MEQESCVDAAAQQVEMHWNWIFALNLPTKFLRIETFVRMALNGSAYYLEVELLYFYICIIQSWELLLQAMLWALPY